MVEDKFREGGGLSVWKLLYQNANTDGEDI